MALTRANQLKMLFTVLSAFLWLRVFDVYFVMNVCMFIFYRVHAGIDEMDAFINIDLNTFLDVSLPSSCKIS